MKKTFPDLLEPFAFRSISRKRKSDTNQEIRKGYLSCSKHQKKLRLWIPETLPSPDTGKIPENLHISHKDTPLSS